MNKHGLATRHSYEISLNQFFNWKKEDPDDYIKDIRKMSNGTKEKTLDKYEKDIDAYWQHLKKTYKPKYTKNAKLNAVRQYLIEYRIELSQVFWKRLKEGKDKGPRALTQDRSPTRHELRKIIHEGKPIARTIFLMASCTGMRIGEIMKLRVSDIDFNMDPVWVNIRGETTKTGDPRTVFLSDETAIYLRKWVNEERDDYLKAIRQRMERLAKHNHFKGLKDHHTDDEDMVFPVTLQTIESYWHLMLKRANLDQRDPSTRIRVLHIHVLRKYFRANMIKDLGVDVTEALMGHSGYLTQAYRRYSKDQLAELYKKSQDNIIVIQEPKSLEKLDEKMSQKDDEIAKMKAEMTQMNLKILNLMVQKHEKQLNGKGNER